MRVRGYCALCRSRCGCVNVVEDGRLVAVEPDPSHPTGGALCAKGRAAPEIVHSDRRILVPLRRTRPKGDRDPGWQRITWDEALDTIAGTMRRLADAHGPETVAFSVTSPSATAMSDAIVWVERLMRAFGSPNNCYGTEVCNWHKDHATRFTFGAGLAPIDFEHTGCVVFWGHNPSTSWLTHATHALDARARGAKLVVVDPRRAGLATKADLWLRVRPGSDGALALAIAGVMIDEGWFDRAFIARWSNGPLLVRSDTDRLLTARDLHGDGDDGRYVAWDPVAARPVVYDPTSREYEPDATDPALTGAYRIRTARGDVVCRPAFDRYAELCRRYSPERAAAVTWVPAAQIREAARILWHSRPVAHHMWTGVGQTTNATQTSRAISLLYALTGSFDAPGGNVVFPKIPTRDVSGEDLVRPEQLEKALGRSDRPLGPARSGWVTGDDLYRAIDDGVPYRVRALLGFGANLVVTRADSRRARSALRALEFFAHADLFMTPTAELADIVLPVSTCWENENLRVGFEISPDAESFVQWRPRAIQPRGESRSDTSIVFELATRLGLGKEFWNGDVEAAWRAMLGPSGIVLDDVRRSPTGVRVPLAVRHRKYAEREDGRARGFPTPTGKIEIWSETLREHGYDPLPEHVEAAMSPVARPDLASRFPLVLTCAKLPQFCHSQFRAIPRLRKLAPDPEVELHPTAAGERGVADGEWVTVETPDGEFQARARLNPTLDPRVACGQHGWWNGGHTSGAAGYDAAEPGTANYNVAVRHTEADPISGSVPHRAYLCQVTRAGTGGTRP